MTSEPPTYTAFTAHRHNQPLPPHRGSATFRLGETVYSGFAEFLLPADGQAIVAFHMTGDQRSQDFGTNLVIEGTIDSGPFRIECPQCYVRRQIESGATSGGWTLISPVNSPARAEYGAARLVAAATFLPTTSTIDLGSPWMSVIAASASPSSAPW